MKNTNYNPRIVRLSFYRPRDGDRVWTAMKIALEAAMWLTVLWFIASLFLSA